MGYYTVLQGDCIASIADKYGLTQDLIWDHPLNAELKEDRKDRNVLLPGDSVFVPDKRPHEENCVTDNKHVFVKKGVPERLRIRLLDPYDQPRAFLKFEITVEGRTTTGETDSDGLLEVPIRPGDTDGLLIVGDGEERYQLKLGHMNPVTDESGVEMRLSNLAYLGSPCTSEPLHRDEALRMFQQQYELDTSPDEVAEKLREFHAC